MPDLEPFIALVGAVFFGSLGLFVPAFIECVFLSTNGGFGLGKWKLWKNLFLMIFALIAMFAGAFVSIKDIVETYTGHEESNSTTTSTTTTESANFFF